MEIKNFGYQIPECPICIKYNYTPYSIDPCGHNFCKNCIQEWYNINKTCPNCREPINKIHLDIKVTWYHIKLVSNDLPYVLRDNNAQKLFFNKLSKIQFLNDISKSVKFFIHYLSPSWQSIYRSIQFNEGDEIQYRYYTFYNKDYISKIIEYIKLNNKEIKELDMVCRDYFNINYKPIIYSYNTKSKYQHLCPIHTSIEMENGIKMNLIQYSIYVSDDMKEFVKNSPVDINKEYIKLIYGIEKNIKNIDVVKFKEIPKNYIDVNYVVLYKDIVYKLYNIIKHHKIIHMEHAKEILLNHFNNISFACSICIIL
jgi:hypothetical protein